MYAKNDFDVTVSDETARTRYGLPADAVLPAAPGEVTLLLRPDSDIVPESGQILLSGVTVLDDVDLTSPEGFALSDTDLLQKTLEEHPQYYRAYRVCNVIVTDAVKTDTLLMQEDDLTALFGRSGAYTDLRVSVTPDIDVGSVCSLLTSLYGWVAVHPLNGSAPTLTQSGELWDALIITGFRYDQLLTAIAVLLLLAAPFIWFCQQYSHYRKRKSDLETLLLLGQTRAGLRKVRLTELVLVESFNHTRVCTLSDGSVLETPATLASLYGQVKASGAFFMPHRAYIVNLAYMYEVREDVAVLEDGTELRISRPRRKQFLNSLADYIAGANVK